MQLSNQIRLGGHLVDLPKTGSATKQHFYGEWKVTILILNADSVIAVCSTISQSLDKDKYVA